MWPYLDYFLNPKQGNVKAQTLTSELFRKILRKRLFPKLSQFEENLAPVILESGQEISPKILLTLDNDPKHYSRETVDMLEKKNVGLFASFRRKDDGSYQDRVRGPGGHMKTFYEQRFPTFSPDLNIIEKVWREVQKRVYAREGEIHSWDEHERVIKEEWLKLEFERTNTFCGINHLVSKIPTIMEECLRQNGYDTIYMQQ